MNDHGPQPSPDDRRSFLTKASAIIVGGMTFGTFLTLFVVPTAYTLLAGHTHDAVPAEAVAPHVPLPQPGHAD